MAGSSLRLLQQESQKVQKNLTAWDSLQTAACSCGQVMGESTDGPICSQGHLFI